MNKPTGKVRPELRVHPLADRFPMLSEREISELAEDIATHGLVHDIIIDNDVLIDGRNRLKACEIGGVEPRFREFPWTGAPEGKEAAITAYIVSENIRRRHLNVGQQAIMLALAYPEPRPGMRTDLMTTSVNLTEVSTRDLSRARAIVKWAPEWVDEILDAGGAFSKAFAIADERRKQAAPRSCAAPMALRSCAARSTDGGRERPAAEVWAHPWGRPGMG
jgi:hypothetical protein